MGTAEPSRWARLRLSKSSVSDMYLGVRSHFEHHAGHAGCPCGDSYSGIPSPHPDVV
jgi:hypothetical protein